VLNFPKYVLRNPTMSALLLSIIGYNSIMNYLRRQAFTRAVSCIEVPYPVGVSVSS
jgi:hypothetical protein